MYNHPQVYSSYKQHNLGKVLYDLVIKLKPKKIIDFGVLFGYSTISMAQALKDLRQGRLVGYDLFENYPYKHATKGEVWENIKKYQVEDTVSLKKKDFMDWIKEGEGFDLLHLDISNDGVIIKLAAEKLKRNLKKGAVIVFEGGTKDRDQVEWMVKYHKTPINPLKKQLGYKVLTSKFPGLSILQHKI